jgi:hypothetical protein
MGSAQFPKGFDLIANQREFLRPTPTFELAFALYSRFLREWSFGVHQPSRAMDAGKFGAGSVKMPRHSTGDVLSNANV